MNRTFIASVYLAGLLLAATTATAAPIAQVPPLNATGKEMVQAGMDFGKRVPDAAQVPYPAYPGSYFLHANAGAEVPKGMMSSVVLVSNDPVKKVRDWYAKHLNGMRYYSDLHAFAPSNFKGSAPALYKTPHIGLYAVTAKSVNATFFELPDVKTKIWIDYYAK